MKAVMIVAASAALLCAAPPARAADYPAKPITLMIGFAPGGPSDVMARIITRKMEEILKQPLVIENRAPLPLTDIQVTPVLIDAQGNIVQQAKPVKVGKALKPGERVSLDAGVGAIPQEQLNAVRFRVDSARIAENTAQ